MAPVYKGGKSVDEVGGGICQPSSTLYLAALNSNLKIVERHQHQFAVGYVPDGLDATVYYGSLDFRFENDTDYPVKLVAKSYKSSGSTYLTVTIYGTKTDDLHVKMTNKVYNWVDYNWVEYETVYQVDAAVPAGTVKEGQNGYKGRNADTYRNLYDAEGNLVSSTLESTNKYKVRERILLVNPADAAQYGLNADGTPLAPGAASSTPAINPAPTRTPPPASESPAVSESPALSPDPSASPSPEAPPSEPSQEPETSPATHTSASPTIRPPPRRRTRKGGVRHERSHPHPPGAQGPGQTDAGPLGQALYAGLRRPAAVHPSPGGGAGRHPGHQPVLFPLRRRGGLPLPDRRMAAGRRGRRPSDDHRGPARRIRRCGRPSGRSAAGRRRAGLPAADPLPADPHGPAHPVGGLAAVHPHPLRGPPAVLAHPPGGASPLPQPLLLVSRPAPHRQGGGASAPAQRVAHRHLPCVHDPRPGLHDLGQPVRRAGLSGAAGPTAHPAGVPGRLLLLCPAAPPQYLLARSPELAWDRPCARACGC
jgi:hypothetical protein